MILKMALTTKSKNNISSNLVDSWLNLDVNLSACYWDLKTFLFYFKQPF